MQRQPEEIFELELTEDEFEVLCKVLEERQSKFVNNGRTEDAEICHKLLGKISGIGVDR